ncbi:hypothetical protein CHCC14820_0885 [Bacillus paralicheniformis]|nr:hypothetical protein SC10_B2orf00212 [Bacillus paralicheniformis]TWN07555.1 hypothetical protein CHCC14566_2024 [Bacillus licheniformis]OLG01827.1 hypothetical protein B4123_4411 [Bacillus paralicheniformis]OLG02917.1 hypothetical protein B4125_3796 [Bacillus paralicheniformis]TWJ54087.1 hypothetical protein CHCC5023_3637 [Bacillus paralicheniformis]
MFYVLAALIALSIFFGFGHDISGLMYQKITSLMFALSVIFGTIYLFILKRKY